jgi:cytochrome c oxidase subunit III
MYALPAAPAPPPRRQVLVGTAIGSAAALMLTGGMIAVWIRMRQSALDAGDPWVPSGVRIPEVPANVMLIGFLALLVFAHWVVYAVGRRDRLHVGLSLGLVALLGLAIVNAQLYIYSRIQLPVADSGYAGMFYAITGMILALMVIGLVFTGVAAFRILGGRDSDHELVVGHLVYWYVVAASFAIVWLIVYVTK